MLYDEYSLRMAKNANFGLADMLYLQFLHADMKESVNND